ncbi:Pre-mRNA-processing ATP-dependent RNA helicase PRP5 [Frankliniella fusca]|uniref:Pre-mRNA-processing ATP-dependent RNA helicase PRP5 n=1 Tax=Frankliniella fusca TaxID=407009 RepID=A0AAE1L853_9NEOP|nr:Pre-mRNA-processing ATP-dependent RNA helicase PRP5 [Frankliniella fusca]
MSGSETLLFLKLFGIVIGDQVPTDDDYWRLYIKLRELLDICLCKQTSPYQSLALKVLIAEFNMMYVEVTGDNLKPKFHHLVHYPSITEKTGPVALTSTQRFESKHKAVLQPAHACQSRKKYLSNSCNSTPIVYISSV